MRKSQKILTVLAVPLLCAVMTVLGAPAMAATSTAPGPNGRSFELESLVNGRLCAMWDGSTSAVTLVPVSQCSASNIHDLWYHSADDFDEFVNQGSGTCLSVTGTDAGVYLHTCVANQHAQEWTYNLPAELLKNVHTGYCMWQSNLNIQQRNSCDSSSVHDQWIMP
jgi:hypothetical protein